MATSGSTCNSQGCEVEVPGHFQKDGLCLDHYLAEASQKLEVAAIQFRSGQTVDDDTVGWLLIQVELVVDTIGDETMVLSSDQRSKMLELLLGIANLHEHIRHYAPLASQSH